MNNKKQLSSIAIWSNDEPLAFHVDVNVWVTDKESDSYLELGIKIFDYQETLSSISCYLPYEIEKQNFEDMGAFLSKDADALMALFNTDISINGKNDNSAPYVNIKFTGKSDNPTMSLHTPLNCDIHTLNNDNIATGSILNFKLQNINDCDKSPVYLRFRINKLSKLFSCKLDQSYILSGKRERGYDLDFKINSLRNLPPSIKPNIRDANLKSVNLFVMSNSSKKLEFSTLKPKAVRHLEDHIWDEYLKIVDRYRMDSNIVAYQWSSPLEKPNMDYKIFVRMTSGSTNWRSIIFSTMLIIIFGIASGLVNNKLSVSDTEDTCVTEIGENLFLPVPHNECESTTGE